MNTLKRLFRWYFSTAGWLFSPVLFILSLLFAQTVLFTTTCHIAGFQCQYAFSAERIIAGYAAAMLDANGEYEVRK